MGALDRIFRGRRGGQERPLAAQIAALFANGEQGLWYDPSDLSTMYQDATGTLPVYMPGQGQIDPPVGLILDKRRGALAGLEQVVNGDCSYAPTLFGAGMGFFQASASASGGTYNISASVLSSTCNARFSATSAAIGRYYKIAFDILVPATFTSALVRQTINGVTTTVVTVTARGTWQRISYISQSIVTASDRPLLLEFLNASSLVDAIAIDNVSVRELPGNHAYQTTTASRPTLSARYNLLIYNDDLSAWSKTGVTASADAVTENTATSQHYVAQTLPTVTSGTKLRLRVDLRQGSGTRNVTVRLLGASGSADALVDPTAGTVVSSSTTGVNWSLVGSPTLRATDDGWLALEFVALAGESGAPALYLFATAATNRNYAGDGVSTIRARRLDVRVDGDGVGLPPYQRVVDANTYDTLGFPLYLKFDGVDDFLQTASLDFSGADKVALFAAIRKLNDGAHGAVCEFSADGSANAGVFSLFAPIQALYSYRFVSKGIYSSDAGLAGFASPHSAVISGVGNISGDVSYIRVNQSSTLTSAIDQGTGNYGNYPLYIGRRGGTTFPFNGRIYSLMIRAGAANDSQIGRVERYLNQKAKVF